MDMNEFLKWLLSSGGIIIALSWICERWTWFKAQSSQKKEWLFFGLTAVVWAVTYAIVTYVPVAVIDAISPWFLGISGLFVSVIIGKLFHETDKLGKTKG